MTEKIQEIELKGENKYISWFFDKKYVFFTLRISAACFWFNSGHCCFFHMTDAEHGFGNLVCMGMDGEKYNFDVPMTVAEASAVCEVFFAFQRMRLLDSFSF